MDFGVADGAVKRAMALGRKIDFVKKHPGLTDAQRAQLLAPLEAERTAILTKGAEQGTLPLEAPGPVASTPQDRVSPKAR